MQKKDKSKENIKFNGLSQKETMWQSAMPLGNGRVGALVSMAPNSERISFVTIAGTYGGEVGVLPDVSDKFKEAKNQILASNPVLAAVNMENALKNKKYNPSTCWLMPIADLDITILSKSKVSSYFRELSLCDEEAFSSYTSGKISVEKRAFISHKDDLFYYEISKSGEGSLDLELNLSMHDKSKIVYGEDVFLPEGAIINEDQTINICYYEQAVNLGAYGAVMRVLVDNKAVIATQKGKVRIENAERVLLIVKVYVGKTREKLLDKYKSELLSLRNISYEKMFKDHKDVYSKKWGKQEVVLSYDKDNFFEEKLNCDYAWVCEKLILFSKYLLINGYDENRLMPFVYGLWASFYGNIDAMADTTLSLPLLYSMCGPLGLLEYEQPVVDYVIKYLDDTKKVANRLYKCSGYEVPNTFVLGSFLPGKIDADNLSVISGGARIANLLYEYFLYSKDMKFLKTEALPFMCGVADFYLAYFKRNENSGVMESIPSKSYLGRTKNFENKNNIPEKNAVADFVLVKSLLTNIINASNVYSVFVGKIVEYQNFLAQLPVKTFLKDGVREYLSDEASERSSGVLHLYPVFGSKEVNLYTDPQMVQMVTKYIKDRMEQNISSFSPLALAVILESLAVLGQKDLFFNLLQFLIKNYLSGNLMMLTNDKFNLSEMFAKENEFNIAVNMAVSKAIITSFVFDYENNVVILPCKPKYADRASLQGITTKNNVIVDISYDDKKGSMVVAIKANRATNFNLLLPKGIKKIKGFNFDADNPRIDNVQLAAGKTITFDIKY